MKLGIDLTDIRRIEKLLLRTGGPALRRIWTDKELENARNSKGEYRNESLAAGFACKEAVAKALGTGFGTGKVTPAEIEVLHETSGKPYVVLHGSTLEYFRDQGCSTIEISLTHTDETAAAVCLIF